MNFTNNRLIVLRQLDKKLSKYQPAQSIEPPAKGWLNAIRNVLNMSLKQLGDRLKMTAQGMKNLEEKRDRFLLNFLQQIQMQEVVLFSWLCFVEGCCEGNYGI